MYAVYKIFGKLSKIFSNILIVIAIPSSLVLAGLGWALFCIYDIIDSIGASDLIDPITGNQAFVNAIPIIKWVGLALGLFFTLAIVILLISWILKRILFKRIADNYITRNKEWRNRDINKTIEKLEGYRYRD